MIQRDVVAQRGGAEEEFACERRPGRRRVFLWRRSGRFRRLVRRRRAWRARSERCRRWHRVRGSRLGGEDGVGAENGLEAGDGAVGHGAHELETGVGGVTAGSTVAGAALDCVCGGCGLEASFAAAFAEREYFPGIQRALAGLNASCTRRIRSKSASEKSKRHQLALSPCRCRARR